MNSTEIDTINLLLRLLPQQSEDVQVKMLDTIDKIIEVSKSSNLDYMIREYKNLSWSLQSDITVDVAMRLERFIPVLSRSYDELVKTNDMYRRVLGSSLDSLETRMKKIEDMI